MAWQLDCVACGVAPVDARHAAVLGRSLLVEGENEIDVGGYEMELQIISRSNGQVLSADTLPLASKQSLGRSQQRSATAATAALLSSFAVPRMDNASELQGEDEGFDSGGGSIDPIQMTSSLFSSEAQRTFRDSHLKWDMNLVVQEKLLQHSASATGPGDVGDSDSVDSDDYDLMSNPITEGDRDSNIDGVLASPPIMVIASRHDLVLAQMRDIDDAISSALADSKAALALRRGLGHLRQLRQYDIRDLVSEYFRAVLKLSPATPGESVDKRTGGHLSLRRMKLAAEAMPILLGGDVSMWSTWIRELEVIPGALFIARTCLPVRGESVFVDHCIFPFQMSGAVF